ncbi:unnamed protein product [Gordionus sp. m RMFG-2023]
MNLIYLESVILKEKILCTGHENKCPDALSYYVEHYIKTRNIRSQNDNNSNARDIKIDRYMLCTATRK